MIYKEILHRRNAILFSLIVVFYFIQVSINVLIEGVASVFPPVIIFMIAATILLLFIIKKINPVLTMYTVIIFTYLYFFFLLTDSPYLINYLFMWLGLPLSAVYQNYRAVLLAGTGSLLLTFYAFFSFRNEIFPNVASGDFVFFLIFGLFLMGFLFLFIKVTHLLWKQSEESSNKLNHVLQQTDIITWSYDPSTDRLSLSNKIPNLPELPDTLEISGKWMIDNCIHSEDSSILRNAFFAIKKGEAQTAEYRVVNSKGDITWLQCRGVSFSNEEESASRVEGILIDITKQKQMEEHIKKLAYYDSLTGAANRYKLKQNFESLQKMESTLAILFIDMNAFKQVNDTYGHEAGDLLLQKVSARIQEEIAETDLLCRMGGDEFVILLSNVDDAMTNSAIHRIQEALSCSFEVKGISISVSASIGRSSIVKASQANLDRLLQQADREMYSIKARE
ncbi:GGDEF domain-containing protein [Cytobacillus massiliigabonensis]|uniref:GGDEF domain-containing protein n=1 Tax=Cytobacillus massiliigabonensis TaxID=1871011 RepID=UPI000C81970D|nr:GGDEF domain-containing protein [Cytobacillus massiliigabonensis]